MAASASANGCRGDEHDEYADEYGGPVRRAKEGTVCRWLQDGLRVWADEVRTLTERLAIQPGRSGLEDEDRAALGYRLDGLREAAAVLRGYVERRATLGDGEIPF